MSKIRVLIVDDHQIVRDGIQRILKDEDDIELTKKIIKLCPDIKVLILSMFNNEEYIVSAIQAGAKGYLPKQDSTTEILLEAIRIISNGYV